MPLPSGPSPLSKVVKIRTRHAVSCAEPSLFRSLSVSSSSFCLRSSSHPSSASQNRPLGFSTDRLLLLETVAGKGQLPVVWNQTAEALRAVPGVNSVAISGWPLLGRIKINSDISINGAPPSPTPAFFLNVSPGWLSTMKIPLVSGRDFRPEDASPGAAIVNETFAKTFFPGQDPIGRTFERGASQPLNTIVGVTPDIPDHDLREPNPAVFYVPFNGVDDKSAPDAVGFATFVLHTDAQNPLALANTLRQIIAQRHNGLRVSNITTQLDLVRDQTIRERLIAMLAAFFAAVALLLAGIGLYAVLNYSVLQRRREIGIRMAIGSTRAGIVRIVTLDVFVMIALGGCAGVALGFGAARYVAVAFLPGQSNRRGYDRTAGVCHSAHRARCHAARRASRAAHRPHRDPARRVRESSTYSELTDGNRIHHASGSSWRVHALRHSHNRG